MIMDKELKIYFERGCNAILITSKYVLNNCNIRSSSDICHDFTSCNANINNEVEKIFKSYLSPMRVPIFNANLYNDTSIKKELHYWVINPSSNLTRTINRKQDFLISLVLMYNQNILLSIVSVPLEDKLYFEYSDKGVFVIEDCRKKQYNLTAEYLLNTAKFIPAGDLDSSQIKEIKHPNTHYWIG